MKHAYYLVSLSFVWLTSLISMGNPAFAHAFARQTPNQPPIANFVQSATAGQVPLEVYVDGTLSTDADGAIINYRWDFGDGTIVNGPYPTLSHTYLTFGTKIIRLTVTDNQGGTDTKTNAVTVSSAGTQLPIFAVEEAYVSESQPASVFNGTEMRVKTYPGVSNYAYLKFDLLGFQFGINQAYLVLFPKANTDLIPISAFGTTTNWDESAITAINAPQPTTPSLTTTVMNNPSSPVLLDVTNYVVDQQESEQELAFRLESLTITNANAIFRTDEDGLAPALLIFPSTNQAPVPQFVYSPATAITNESVSFNASASSDPDGTISSYVWDFGDGSSGTGQNATHTFTSGGTYEVVLSVTDNLGLVRSTSMSVEVNTRPTASFTASPSTGPVSLLVAFDASASSDSDGSIQSYEWDFGDGGISTIPATAHPYTSVGTYIATLTVTDNDGATHSTSKTIVVTAPNQDPIADFSFNPGTPTTASLINFDASASNDPDGSIATYTWTFGDGNTASGQNPTHSYSNAGPYSVTLTVTDNQGASAFLSKTVSVGTPNVPPVAASTVSPITGHAPLLVTFDGSGSSDPDGTIQTYEWNFGDGGISSLVTTGHPYTSAGTYIATLTVTDNDGASHSISTTITVLPPNQVPTARFSFSPASPLPGQSITFNGSNSSDPDGTIDTYTWDFGDGGSA
ncbi:MAG: PKD domain-containing protein, partial [Bacteroidota bacterium]